MKIIQEPSFKPVTITLTTREEADAFWGILCEKETSLSAEPRALAIKLSNWFSNNYR